MNYTQIILIAFILLSCTAKDKGFKRYEVKQGEHKFKPNLVSFENREINFKFRLDASCLYDLKDVEEQTFVSKITGLSDCNSLHSKNAIYLGWQPIFNEIGYHTGNFNIYAYWRIEGVFYFEKLLTTSPDSDVIARLRITDKFYKWNVNGKLFDIERKKKCNNGIHYRIQPYFGGKQKAPHNMIMYLNIL